MYLKNLAKLRKEKKLTQEGLARKANISYHTLIKLAEALGVSMDKLAGRS